MSNINVLFVKNDKVYYTSVHYRVIIDLFNHNFSNLSLLLANLNSFHVDAGYMIIDLDRQEVINRQLAFSASNLAKKPLVWSETF